MADRPGLGERQAALVAALVAGAPLPAGFDPTLVGAAREALLRKRAGEVARIWPALAASFRPGWSAPVTRATPLTATAVTGGAAPAVPAGSEWPAPFVAWAAGRPPAGALRDGWDFARALSARGALSGAAARELADREARWHYDGISAPRSRSLAGRILRRMAGR